MNPKAVSAPLYNRDILALAVENAQYPPLTDADLHGSQRSAICGSRVGLDLCLDDWGRIIKLGMKVEACALGQASASLFARHALGLDEAAMRQSRDQLWGWLRGEADGPSWPEFSVLAAVKDYPARHSAVMLPFDVAVLTLDHAPNSEGGTTEGSTTA